MVIHDKRALTQLLSSANRSLHVQKDLEASRERLDALEVVGHNVDIATHLLRVSVDSLLAEVVFALLRLQ